ncbi:MAG: hypothetical protein ABI769_13605 [Pseudomonadota bacterium]
MDTSKLQDLTGALRQLIADAEALLLDEAGEHARAGLHRACDHLRAAEREVSAKAHEFDRLVRANPWRAIAATGLIGFLLGLLARRR